MKIPTVIVDVIKIYSVVFIGCVALVKRSKKAILTTKLESHYGKVVKRENAQYEYNVERIIHHENDCERAKFLVRWHDNSPADRTENPSHHVHLHFVCCK